MDTTILEDEKRDLDTILTNWKKEDSKRTKIRKFSDISNNNLDNGYYENKVKKHSEGGIYTKKIISKKNPLQFERYMLGKTKTADKKRNNNLYRRKPREEKLLKFRDEYEQATGIKIFYSTARQVIHRMETEGYKPTFESYLKFSEETGYQINSEKEIIRFNSGKGNKYQKFGKYYKKQDVSPKEKHYRK